MNLVIDSGNTRIKFALFDKDRIVDSGVADSKRFFEELYEGQTRAVQTACDEKCRKYDVEVEE